MENLDQPKSLKTDTLDFIFNFVKDAPEHQLEDANMLDNKVIQILSVASIIIGLLGFGIRKIALNHVLTIISLIVVILAYIAVVCFAIIHLKAAAFRRSLHADELWQEHWDNSVLNIKHDLVSDISEAYSHNKSVLSKKNKTLFGALIALGIQVVSVGVFIASFLLG